MGSNKVGRYSGYDRNSLIVGILGIYLPRVRIGQQMILLITHLRTKVRCTEVVVRW